MTDFQVSTYIFFMERTTQSYVEHIILILYCCNWADLSKSKH
jgi:hypothetical protein